MSVVSRRRHGELTLEQLRAAEVRALERIAAIKTGAALATPDSLPNAERTLRAIRTQLKRRTAR